MRIGTRGRAARVTVSLGALWREAWGVAFGLFAMRALASEPWGLPVGEAGRIRETRESSAMAEMKNDSYAIPANGDWDDLRSFGVFAGFSAFGWAAGFTADGLTKRGDIASEGSRVDELYASAGRELWRWAWRFGDGETDGADEGERDGSADAEVAKRRGDRAEGGYGLAMGVSLYAGAMALGNFGMREIQEGAHKLYGSYRPFPEEYDEIGDRLTAIANPIARFALTVPGGRTIDAGVSIEAGHAGFLRGLAFASIPLIDGVPDARVIAGFRWAGASEAYGRTFRAVIAAENGPYLGASFGLGYFESRFVANLATGAREGSVSLAIPYGESRKRAGFLGSAKSTGATGPLSDHGKADANGSTNGTTRLLEYLVQPLRASIRLEESIAETAVGNGDVTFVRLSPALGVDSGPSLIRSPRSEYYTFFQAYLALDLTLSILGVVEPYALAGLGARTDTWQTCYVTTSSRIATRSSSVEVAEVGVRFLIPARILAGQTLGVSVATGIEGFSTFFAGTRGYTRIALVGAGRR